MPYRGTPSVRNQRLQLPDDTIAIRLDTPAWFLWLQTATHFSYALGQPTYYCLTFRHEKRRHGWYWYAYLKIEAKLHNAYAGRSEDLTTQRLHLVAQTVVDKGLRAQLAAQLKGDNMTS
jgi:LuxR family transcriptional regulator, maltose regulon positive regulatory protein